MGAPPPHIWSAPAQEAIAKVHRDLRGAPNLLQRMGLSPRPEPLTLDFEEIDIASLPKDEIIVLDRSSNRAQNALQCVSLAAPDEPMLDYRYILNVSRRVLRGVVYFSAFAEGPPGAAHGGMI